RLRALMKTRTFASAIVVSSVFGGAAWGRWTLDTSGVPDRAGVPQLRAPTSRVDDDSLAAAEDAIVTNDPFRLSNSPPAVRYDPAADGPGAAVLALLPQPRPVLVLKAIVGGPPWQAVIDGLPGQPAGTVARAGSTYDRLVVRSVTRDSVVVQGADTLWVLSFRAR
ncbi:MAG: hypothetical protein ACREPM_25385, partial [Gemmatimonadaceae bacterium]